MENNILGLFRQPETHPTADELYKGLVAKFGKVDRTAFENTLKSLLKANKVYFVVSSDNSKHYGRAKGTHCHFICEDCGKVRDFHVEEGAENMLKSYIQNQTKSYGRPNRLNLSVVGVCHECE
jgi:Fur family transcriptional regulator, peroxide stress response regulator